MLICIIGLIVVGEYVDNNIDIKHIYFLRSIFDWCIQGVMLCYILHCFVFDVAIMIITLIGSTLVNAFCASFNCITDNPVHAW